MDHIEIIIIIIEFDLKDKIESNKRFDKKTKKKNKNYKMNDQIKYFIYKLEIKKTFHKRKNDQDTKIKTKRIKFEISIIMRIITLL